MDTSEHRSDAGRALIEFFSSASPTGLFRPGSVSEEAQEEILASVDKLLPESDARACEGLVTIDDLKASLDSMSRGKQPGSDGLPYELYSAFWPQVGPLLEAAFREALKILPPRDCLHLSVRGL